MIKLSSQGPEVLKVQQMLKMLGHRVIVDGDFGPGTLAAVLQFQKQNGMSADGVVGNATEEALLKATETQRAKMISSEELEAGAKKVGVAPEALMAVRDVESLGFGFLSSGKAVILFEGHVFWKKLKEALTRQSIRPEMRIFFIPSLLPATPCIKWISMRASKRLLRSISPASIPHRWHISPLPGGCSRSWVFTMRNSDFRRY